MTKFAAIALFIVISVSAAAQNTEPTTPPGTPKAEYRRPDIPGTFVLELGINSALNAPSDFSLGLWGSRTVNIYYQYPIRIMNSKFSIVPGFGLSLERFKFKSNRVLGYDADTLSLLATDQSGIAGVKKSHLVTNYFEVPLELRFSTNPEDPSRGFKLAFGGRIGYLYDAFSKVKYKVDGDTRKLKDKQDWNLTRFRYGVYGKIGFGNFNLFGYYNLTPLFKEGEGIWQGTAPVDFQTITMGISLSSF